MFDRANPGGSFLFESNKPEMQVHVVSMNYLGQWMQKRTGASKDFRVALLKIDVEGQEPWLLRGGEEFWAKHRPKLLVMEIFHPRVTREGCQLAPMLRGMILMGYSIRVFPRLDLSWSSHTLLTSEESLARFLRVVKASSEMDILAILEDRPLISLRMGDGVF